MQTIDGFGVRPAQEGERVIGVTSATAGTFELSINAQPLKVYTTENNIEITDAALAIRGSTSWTANFVRIVIHDTLPSPIILEPGQSINWNYIIEVAYPNP